MREAIHWSAVTIYLLQYQRTLLFLVSFIAMEIGSCAICFDLCIMDLGIYSLKQLKLKKTLLSIF
jgi:hypothetical protein